MSKINLISTGQSAITLPRGREVPAVAGTPFQLDSMADAEWLVRAGAAEIVAAPKAEGEIDVTKLSAKELAERLKSVNDLKTVNEMLDAENASAKPRASVQKLLLSKIDEIASDGDDPDAPAPQKAVAATHDAGNADDPTA